MSAASTTFLHKPSTPASQSSSSRWQYHDLINRGKLTSDDPVELIEGVLVFKMPKNPLHAIVTEIISDLLTAILPIGWHVRIQEPVTLKDGEPEPDLVIAIGKRLDYAAHHPFAEQIGLLIEISESTLDRDRGIKLRTYAHAAISHYGIINLTDRQVEVYTDPDSKAKPPSYRKTQIFRLTDSISLELGGNTIGQIAVAEVLPPR